MMPYPAPQRQAVMWEVRLREGEVDVATLAQFEQWRTATEDNARAWDYVQQRLGRADGLADARAQGAAMAHALRAPADERRRALRAAFGLLVLGVGAWGAREGWQQLGLDADWRSAVGQRGHTRLADGTPMAYDAASRIYLGGSAQAPRLRLQQGQLLLQAQDGGSRHSVETAHGVIEAQGAVLQVGRLQARSVVALQAGSALVRVHGGAPLALTAGQTCYLDHDGAQRSALSFGAASAWTRGLFVADRAPLAELLEVFSRYHRGLLRASGKAATRPVSGVFRLADIDQALLQVADALPLTITRYGRYLTVLS